MFDVFRGWLRALCSRQVTVRELSSPRSVGSGTWKNPGGKITRPGRWKPEEPDPVPERRPLRRGLRGLAVAAALAIPARAFPPASHFVTIGGESGLVQVVSAAYYAAHGNLDGFDPSAVHASTSDRLDLAGQLTPYEKRRRYADMALYDRNYARLVLEAHYFSEGL